MEPIDPSLKQEPVEPNAYDKYLLKSKAEILFVLRGMRDHQSQVIMFFNEGKDTILTALLAVEDDHLLFDYGPSDEVNRKALAARRLFCTAAPEKVKIQFILSDIQKVDHEGGPAFRTTLPDSLLRLQRREYYRLTTPVLHRLDCHFTLAPDDGPAKTLECKVIDISGGGMALAPPDGFDFIEGMRLSSCRLDLPDTGTIIADAEVRSVFQITLRNGSSVSRAGCEFIDLPVPMQNLVQRYIIRVERERKARESGME